MFSCYHFLSFNYFNYKRALLIATTIWLHCSKLMWKELRLPDLAPLPLKQNGTISVNQKVRLLNKVKANRETCKVWKMCVHYTRSICRADEVRQHKKKNKYIHIQKWNDKCISQQRIFRRLLQWWWTTRWDIIKIGQRGIVLYGQAIFSDITLWWQKNRTTQSGHVRLRARVAMEEDLLSAWVSQSIGQSRSVDENCYLCNSWIATFATRDLQKQCRKSYIYHSIKVLVLY